jgi:hypothetical protein
MISDELRRREVDLLIEESSRTDEISIRHQ